MKKLDKYSSCSIPFVLSGVLTGSLILLKLTGVIGWSWLWVFSPVLVQYSMLLAYIVIVSTVYTFHVLYKGKKKEW